MENLNTSVKFERDGKEYKLLNKCVNNYLINQNKSIEIGTINKIEKILSELQEYDYKIIDSYLEINNYKINSIDELLELISNIEDYQLIEVHNNKELGKYILENLPDFDTPEYLYEFLDIEKLGKKFLTINNIKYSFCSNGVLLNTRLMLGNDLITGRIKKEHRIRLLVANKQMYKKDSSCKKIEILFPISEKKLQEKIELLDLKNDNIEILECYMLNLYPKSDTYLTLTMERIMNRLSFREKEISLSDVQELSIRIQKLNNSQIEKFTALLECKETDISSLKEIIKLTDEIKNYELLPDVKNLKEMGEFLVNETGHFDDVSTLSDYINYEKLAEEYSQNGCVYSGRFTDTGYLMKKECLEIEQNNEEEFE